MGEIGEQKDSEKHNEYDCQWLGGEMHCESKELEWSSASLFVCLLIDSNSPSASCSSTKKERFKCILSENKIAAHKLNNGNAVATFASACFLVCCWTYLRALSAFT
jgi:hypothetical protein